MKKAYSFLKRNSNEERHIFEGDFTVLPHCNAEPQSICKKVQIKDGIWAEQCLDENQARLKAAQLGRVVCGTCVSYLYSSY